MFNILYHDMVNSAHLFKHIGSDPITKEHWEITAWNAAWVAAGHMDWIDTFCEQE